MCNLEMSSRLTEHRFSSSYVYEVVSGVSRYRFSIVPSDWTGGYRVTAAYNIVDINTLQARGCTAVCHGPAVSGLGSNCQCHRLQRRSILVNATIVI